MAGPESGELQVTLGTRAQRAPDARKIPPDVESLQVSETHEIQRDGSYVSGIAVHFRPPRWYGELRYDVFVEDAAAASGQFVCIGSLKRDGGFLHSHRFIRGRTYTVAVVSTSDGKHIDPADAPNASVTIAAETGAAPPDVADFDAQPDCDVLFTWTPVVETRNDVRHYEIRQGATWAGGSLVCRVWGWRVAKARVPALSLPLALPADPTFHIKAVTGTSLESDTEDSDTLTAIELICLGPCLPPCYVCGAGITFVNVDEVTVGSASFESHVRDSTDEHDIRWTAALSANITVVGAPGGLDVGAEAADTWYAVHVIGDSTCVLAAAALLSLSATAPTLPTGYDKFRRVGWVRNNGSSAFLRFTQTCDGPVRHYEYDEARTALQVLAGGNAIVFTTVSMVSLIPPDSRDALLAVGVDPQTVNDGLRLRPTGSTVLEANAVERLTPGVTQQVDALPTRVTVGASQDIDYAVTSVATMADIYVVGFVDHI